MAEDNPYIEVCYYKENDDTSNGNNYRPELVVGDNKLLLDSKVYRDHGGCMNRLKANSLAKKIASELEIDVRLVALKYPCP